MSVCFLHLLALMVILLESAGGDGRGEVCRRWRIFGRLLPRKQILKTASLLSIVAVKTPSLMIILLESAGRDGRREVCRRRRIFGRLLPSSTSIQCKQVG